MKATVSHREPHPGETCFGGGKGILIPYRLDRTRPSAEPSKDAEPSRDSAPQEADPMQGAADIIEKALDEKYARYMARNEANNTR